MRSASGGASGGTSGGAPLVVGYYPTVYMNDFWLLRDALVPLDARRSRVVNLTLTVAPLGLWRWQVMEQIDRTFARQRALGAARDGDGDEMKRVLLPATLGTSATTPTAATAINSSADASDSTVTPTCGPHNASRRSQTQRNAYDSNGNAKPPTLTLLARMQVQT